MTSGIAFQDDVFCKGNHCWVCGNENPHGLNIKSYWDRNESVRTWQAVVSCSLYSDGTECACGEALGVRIPAIAGTGK